MIGLIYATKGDYDNALDYLEKKSLKTRINKLPKNHSDITDTYNNIGVVYTLKKEISIKH